MALARREAAYVMPVRKRHRILEELRGQEAQFTCYQHNLRIPNPACPLVASPETVKLSPQLVQKRGQVQFYRSLAFNVDLFSGGRSPSGLKTLVKWPIVRG